MRFMLNGIFQEEDKMSTYFKFLKLMQKYHTILLISHASKVMLKILQARLQQYANWGLPDVQAKVKRGRRTRDQTANIHWITEKAREFQTATSASLMMLKPLTLWITTDCGKLLKSWEYHTTLPVCCELCMQVKKQQLETDMEQQLGSKLGNEYIKAVYWHPTYLTYMQATLCKCQARWIIKWNHKLESRWFISLWWIISWNQDCKEKY